MTDLLPSNPPKISHGFSTTALVLGLISFALLLVFLTTSAGAPLLTVGIICGLAALVIGIIALKKRQPKVTALIGLITGALTFVAGLALTAFALIFVGALMFNMA